MADNENVSSIGSERIVFVRRPYTTEPIERSSAVPDEVIFTQEQAEHAKRFKTGSTDSEPRAADEA